MTISDEVLQMIMDENMHLSSKESLGFVNQICISKCKPGDSMQSCIYLLVKKKWGKDEAVGHENDAFNVKLDLLRTICIIHLHNTYADHEQINYTPSIYAYGLHLHTHPTHPPLFLHP